MYLSSEGIDELALECQASGQNNWSQERHQTIEKLLKKANNFYYERLITMQNCYDIAKNKGFEEKAKNHYNNRQYELENDKVHIVLEKKVIKKPEESPRIKNRPPLYSPKVYPPNINTVDVYSKYYSPPKKNFVLFFILVTN